jgi:hypothetical protein
LGRIALSRKKIIIGGMLEFCNEEKSRTCRSSGKSVARAVKAADCASICSDCANAQRSRGNASTPRQIQNVGKGVSRQFAKYVCNISVEF